MSGGDHYRNPWLVNGGPLDISAIQIIYVRLKEHHRIWGEKTERAENSDICFKIISSTRQESCTMKSQQYSPPKWDQKVDNTNWHSHEPGGGVKFPKVTPLDKKLHIIEFFSYFYLGIYFLDCHLHIYSFKHSISELTLVYWTFSVVYIMFNNFDYYK